MARRQQAAASESLLGASDAPGPGGVLNRLMRPVDALGGAAVGVWLALADSVGFAAALLAMAVRPRTWRRTVFEQFMRQCYHGGVRAVPMIIILGVLAGAGLVAQALTLFRLAGQEGLAGQFLALVLFREITPVLIGLLLVGRTGAA
ncbi:MAG: hypothetical protein GVY24_07230, partial [Planctomycetes bacterium]|nr:hypothetical protein [Planctomycetota bacterium]